MGLLADSDDEILGVRDAVDLEVDGLIARWNVGHDDVELIEPDGAADHAGEGDVGGLAADAEAIGGGEGGGLGGDGAGLRGGEVGPQPSA